MGVKYDVVATTGVYEKEGQKKYLTRKVGVVISTDKGFRIKLDACFNPAGCQITEDGAIWLALFEPKPRDEQQQQRAPQRQAPRQATPDPDGFDDSVPF